MFRTLLFKNMISVDWKNEGIFRWLIGYSLIVSAGLNPMPKTVPAPILLFERYVIIV